MIGRMSKALAGVAAAALLAGIGAVPNAAQASFYFHIGGYVEKIAYTSTVEILSSDGIYAGLWIEQPALMVWVSMGLDAANNRRLKGYSAQPIIYPDTGTPGPEVPGLESFGRSHTWPVGLRPKVWQGWEGLPVDLQAGPADFFAERCNAQAAVLASQGMSETEIFSQDRPLHYRVGARLKAWQTGLIGLNEVEMSTADWHPSSDEMYQDKPLTVICKATAPADGPVATEIDPTVFAADDILNEAEDMPIQITGGTIEALDPPYVGQCPAQADFRAILQGTGHGEVRVWAFNESQDPVYVSGPLPFYNTEGAWSFDFPYDIKWEGPQSLETKEHVLQLRVTYKNKDEPYFPANQVVLDHTSWSARCLSKTTVDIGGSDGGGLGAFQQAPAAGDAASELTLQPVTDLPSATIQLPATGQRPSLQRDRIERQRETPPRLPERRPQAPTQPIPQ